MFVLMMSFITMIANASGPGEEEAKVDAWLICEASTVKPKLIIYDFQIRPILESPFERSKTRHLNKTLTS
jgi:hypothetical protein